MIDKRNLWMIAAIFLATASIVHGSDCYVQGNVHYANGTLIIEHNTTFQIESRNLTDDSLIVDPQGDNPWFNGTGFMSNSPTDPSFFKNGQSITCDITQGYILVRAWDVVWPTAITEANYTGVNISTTYIPAGGDLYDVFINVTMDMAANPNLSLSANTTSIQIDTLTNASYLLNITNLAKVADNFNLTYSTNATTVYLNSTATDSLGANQSWYVLMNVSGASPGKYVTNITAFSRSNTSRNETLEIQTNISPPIVRGVNITINVTEQNIMSDGNATFLLNITNNGTDTDSYTLTNHTNASNALLNESTITGLASGASYSILLYVWDTIQGKYETNVTVVSDNDANANATVTALTNVTEIRYNVTVFPDSFAKTTANNSNATYQITITNTGTVTETFMITNSTNSSNAWLSQSSVTLNPGQFQNVYLNVTDSILGEYETNVTAYSQTMPEYNDSVTLNTTVMPDEVQELWIENNESGTVQIYNHSYALYEINITNKGTYADNVTLTNTSNASIVNLNQTSIQALAPEQSFIVILNVSDPTPGTYATNVTATSENNVSYKNYTMAYTKIIATFNVSITTNTSLASTIPGQPAHYLVNITNNGTGTGTYTLTRTSNATTTLVGSIGPIGPKQSATTILQVQAATKGEFQTNITVTSDDDPTAEANTTVWTTVLNLPPSISVSMTPDPASSAMNLSCIGIYDDPNLDPPAQVYYKFTGSYSDTGTAACQDIGGGQYNCTANISSTDTAEGYNITCNMTPYDGEVNGTSDSDWLTIDYVGAPQNLIIYLNQTDLETTILEWSPSLDATEYAIFITTNATEAINLSPYDTTRNATTTSTRYTDTSAKDDKRRYYRVAAVKGLAYNLSAETAGKHNITLNAGHNMIGISLEPTNNTINSQFHPASTQIYDRISRYSPTTGWERTDYYGPTWKWWGDFQTLQGGDGFYLYPTKLDYIFTLTGEVRTQNVTKALSSSNLMGFYTYDNKTLDTTVTPSADEDRISTYATDWDRTDHYTGYGWYGDFNEIEPDKGYWFYPINTGYSLEYDPK